MKILVKGMKGMLNTMKTRKEEKRRELHKERLARSFAMTTEERQQMREKNAIRRRKRNNRFCALCFTATVIGIIIVFATMIIPYWGTCNSILFQTKVVAGSIFAALLIIMSGLMLHNIK